MQKHYLELIQNPYGNYFIQDILESIPPHEFKERELLNTEIINNILNLSTQKFSSNVVVKFLNNCCSQEEKKKSVINFFEFDQLSILKKNKYIITVTSKIVEFIPDNEIDHYLTELNKNPKLYFLSNVLITRVTGKEKLD